ncbi:MAG: NAD-dependent epimerase/dehydratase family protein [Rickettsiales bacterium]
MHYLITGGCGFIGSHLVDSLLASGHRVSVLDDLSSGKRENLADGATLIEGDITTPNIFDNLIKDIDGCFHLAAIASVQRSQDEWLRCHQVNLSGTVALFDALMRENKTIPVVYASSAAAYGDCPDIPLKETSHCSPCSAYGADKLSCEYHARIATNMFNIPTIGLRFFNVYGPRQDPASPYSGVISIFAHRMKQHADVIIHGDGEQARDFIYVGDIITVLTTAMQKLESKELRCDVFNACTGKNISVNALAKVMMDVTASRSVISHGPAREGDIRVSLGDGSHAQTALGFTPQTRLEDGLTITLESL